MAASSPQQPPADEELLKLQAASSLNLYNTKSGANYEMGKVAELKRRVVKGERSYLTLEFEAAKASGADQEVTPTTFAALVFQHGTQWWPILCFQPGKPQAAAFAQFAPFEILNHENEGHARGAIAVYNDQHGTNYEVVRLIGNQLLLVGCEMIMMGFWPTRPLPKKFTLTFETRKIDEEEEDHITTFVAEFLESSSPPAPPVLLSCLPINSN